MTLHDVVPYRGYFAASFNLDPCSSWSRNRTSRDGPLEVRTSSAAMSGRVGADGYISRKSSTASNIISGLAPCLADKDTHASCKEKAHADAEIMVKSFRIKCRIRRRRDVVPSLSHSLTCPSAERYRKTCRDLGKTPERRFGENHWVGVLSPQCRWAHRWMAYCYGLKCEAEQHLVLIVYMKTSHHGPSSPLYPVPKFLPPPKQTSTDHNSHTVISQKW